MTRRRVMLPPFHGGRIESYGRDDRRGRPREVARWPMGEPFALWPRMQEITLEVVMRVVFGSVETVHRDACASSCGELTDWLNDPRRL